MSLPIRQSRPAPLAVTVSAGFRLCDYVYVESDNCTDIYHACKKLFTVAVSSRIHLTRSIKPVFVVSGVFVGRERIQLNRFSFGFLSFD